MKKLIYILSLLIVTTIKISAQEDIIPLLTGPYLGQQPPGKTPHIFAPGIVSSNDYVEMGCTWSPDGKEFYFARSETSNGNSSWSIWGIKQEGSVWGDPGVTSFSSKHLECAPFITPDGESFLFYRVIEQENETSQGTWIVKKENNLWGEPIFFTDAYCLNSIDFETFYFTAQTDVESDKNIGQMKYINGVFSKKTKLPGNLNTDRFEAHQCISPDGSYMLFDRIESTFVSFQNKDGTWSKGYDLSKKLHIPCISPDGLYIFYEANGDIYWMEAKIIEQLKPKEMK